MTQDRHLCSVFDVKDIDTSIISHGLSPIHLQVLGFSTISLEDQLNNSSNDINALDIYGHSPLDYAVRRGDAQTVSKLLAYGADPLAASTSIAWTCKGDTGDLQLLKLLLQFGVDPDGYGLDGHTPLHACGIYGRDDEFIKVLIAYGAKIDMEYEGYYEDCTGVTSLGFASLYAHDHTCELLLSYGADLSHVDILGRTPLHLTIAGRSKVMSRVGTLESLLSAGSDPNLRDKAQKTPANYAIQIQDLESLKALMDYDADLVFPPFPGSEKNGFCILSWPIQKHWLDVVLFLLPRVDVRDTDPTTGRTILHALAEAGDLKLLVAFEEQASQQSVPIDVRDKEGHLAIDLATSNEARKNLMELMHRLKRGQGLLSNSDEDLKQTFWDADETFGSISRDLANYSKDTSSDQARRGSSQTSDPSIYQNYDAQSPRAEDTTSRFPVSSQASATRSSVQSGSPLHENLTEKPDRGEEVLDKAFSREHGEDRENDILLMGGHDQNIVRRLDKDPDTDSSYGSDDGEVKQHLLSQGYRFRQRRDQKHITVATDAYFLETSKTVYSWNFRTKSTFHDFIRTIFSPFDSFTKPKHMIVHLVIYLTKVVSIDESTVNNICQHLRLSFGGTRLALRRASRPRTPAHHRRLTWKCVSLTLGLSVTRHGTDS